MLLDISIGYIVSYIFYIIQIYIPDTLKRKKAEILILSKLNNLYKKLCTIIAIFETICDDYNALNDDMYFKIISNKINNKNKFFCFMVTKDSLMGNQNYFTDCLAIIDQIKSSLLFPYTDIELIEWVESVQNIISEENNYCQTINSLERKIDIDYLKKQISILKQIYNKPQINKSMKINSYECIVLNKIEIKEFKKIYNNYVQEIKKVNLRNITIQISIPEVDSNKVENLNI